MDFLRNYEADQGESEDMDSNREQTASPTGSSSSSTSADSPKRRSGSGKLSARRYDEKYDDKDDKNKHKPRKELNENSSSTNDNRASRSSSRSPSTDGSGSKSRSRSPSPTTSRTKSIKNGTNEAMKPVPKTSSANKDSKDRQSKSPLGHQRRTDSATLTGIGSNSKTPAKADQKDRKKSSPPKQDVSKRDRSTSRERDRKNRDKERDRTREREREQRNRERERERERDREREREKNRQKDRERNRDRERERDRDRERNRYDRGDRGTARESRGDYRDQRRVGNWSKSNDRDNNRRDTRGYDRKDDRKDKRAGRDYEKKDHRKNRRSNSRESRNRRRHSSSDRIRSSRTRDSRSRSRSRSRSCSKSSPSRASQQQTPSSHASHAGGLLPTPTRFTQNSTSPTKPPSLLPTPPAAQSLLGAVPLPSTAGIPSLMSIPTKPPIGSLIPPAVAAKLNLSNESKPVLVSPSLATPAQDPAVQANLLLSRSALLRNNAKAAQLEKMGIDVLQQNQKAVDSVPLPSYYNPGVVNPVRYADQVQKRKLLWSHKTTESKEVSSNISKWEQAKFAQDTDGRVASKFLRLMGVKDSVPKAGEEMGSPVPMGDPSSSSIAAKMSSSSGTTGAGALKGGKSTGDSIKKQEELFSTMEQQYEVARQVTHTMRGVGLGFSSQGRQF